MAQPTQQEIDQAKAQAQSLKDNLKNNPQLAQQLKDSPAETLKAQGFPDSTIGDILKKNGIEPEVAGYDYDVCHGDTVCLTAADTVYCTNTSWCENTYYHVA